MFFLILGLLCLGLINLPLVILAIILVVIFSNPILLIGVGVIVLAYCVYKAIIEGGKYE